MAEAESFGTTLDSRGQGLAGMSVRLDGGCTPRVHCQAVGSEVTLRAFWPDKDSLACSYNLDAN